MTRSTLTRPSLLHRICVAATLVLAPLSVVVGLPAPALAVASMQLAKSAPAQVLVGGSIGYTLTATNPTSNPDAVVEYNVGFRDVLPVGVAYTPGSSTPVSFGEPKVFTDPVSGQQTLVWANVADLSPGSTAELAFTAAVSEVTAPVGSTVTNSGTVYANSNPRVVPKFTATGAPVAGSYSQSATGTANTRVTALKLAKAEGSPESELLRGVHDHPTVYTLRVTNNRIASTTGVVVTDLLPAGLEFLGCGGVDNTTTGPEYPGAASLAGTPAVSPCVTPQSVTTVVNPVGAPAGTYTQVVWNLGALATDQVVVIRYAAGIPQRANTASWPGPTPTPTSLGQAANLDNNTGASTREGADELDLTNRARAEGDYAGPVLGGGNAHVTATATHTSSAEDLRLLKGVTPDLFVQGGVARYTLTVDTGEYADASGIVITDHLPNGLCPLSNVANYTTGAPADCAPGAGFAPTNATITAVVQNPDGSFDITFSPLAVAADGTLTVSYSARMRTTFTGGPEAGDPTSAGDSFTNTAALTGTSVPAAGVNPPSPAGPLTVVDDSSATIGAGGPLLDKTILPNTTPIDCAAAGYVDEPPPARNVFTEGSRVCFRIHIDFPGTVSTRQPQITDFLPSNLAYELGSGVPTAANTVALALDESTGNPVWRLGVTTPTGRFVQPGGVFEVILSGIVEAPAAGPAPEITANLAKFRYSNGSGATISLRDSVDLVISAPPPVAVVKGVADVNGVPAPGNPANTDHVQVKAEDVVTFRVDLTNNGTAANLNAVDVLSPDVWDVLPAGISCAAITAISDGGACTDPGAPGHPTFSGNGTRSAVRWQLGATPALAAGATRTLTYDLRIPTLVSVSTVFTNTASVQSFETETNRAGVTAEHLPAGNVDTTSDPLEWDVPAASDPSDVFVADASVAKANVTDITEAGNGAGEAVVGETLTYTVQLRVPPHTTVYNARLTDPLPAGVTGLGTASARFSATGSAPATDPLPVAVTVDPVTGTLTFPATYTNAGDTAHLFEVRIPARVSTLAANVHGVTRVNTATFASDTALTGGTPITPRTASSTITVVAPSPSLTKTDDDADNVVVAGQSITYTLRVDNAAGRPPLHDTWVVDCVPGALVFGSFSPAPAPPGTAGAVAGNGTNGCATGTTRIAWNVPDVLAGAPQQLSYTVTVSPTAAGGAAYTNTATLSGSTLDDDKADPLAADNPDERVLAASAADTVNVAGSQIAKAANQAALTIGQRGSWTIDVTVPANVNFFDAAVIDELPRGIDPATLLTESSACTYAGGGPCAIPGAAAQLAPAAGPGSATRAGWLLGDLRADARARVVRITYSAIVADLVGVDRGDLLTNTARLSWDLVDGADPTSAGATFDRSTGNVTATVTVREPVLSVDKTVSASTAAPGDTFTYTVAVANLAGPDTSAAFDTEVVDSVPVGVVVAPGSISNGGVLTGAGPAGGGTITWTLPGPIAPGATTTLTYAATFAASGTLDRSGLTNTADITHYESLSTGGRVYDGPQDAATITPAFPHVSVAKSVNGALAFIGESKAWTVTVTSDGASRAYDVDVTDTLPLNWTYDAGSATVVVDGGPATPIEPTLGTAGGRSRITWTDLGDLPVGRTIVVTYTATPTPAVVTAPGVGSSVAHSNSAVSSADDATGASANALGSYAGPPASATARIHSADLTVDKSHTGAVVVGRNLSYSVVVSNLGVDPATGPFRVVDDLPAGVGPTTAGGPGWTCSTSLTQATCTRTNAADSLAPGASFPTITVTVAIPADTPTGTDFTNAVAVDAHTYDPDPANNDDTDTATAVRSVDLAISKALSGALVAGLPATYTLDVTNNGPSASSGPIVVTDQLPAGTTFASATGSGWSCAEAAGEVSCTRAAGLTLGESAPQITVVVDVPAARTAEVTNSARVDGPSTDPVPGNNQDSVTTSPAQVADLGLEKESPDDFVPGSTGAYRFTVTNFGPSYAAAPVTITDTLPGVLGYATFASVDGAWSCSAAGQVVTCALTGRLAARDRAVVEVTVDIDAGQTGNIHNEATVGSPTTDPNPANDTDTDDTDSRVEADLGIVKSHVGDVVAGEDLSYTLQVHNDGPSDASGPIVVTDVLPAGMTPVSAAGGGWVCVTPGRTVTCTRAAGLAAGADAPAVTVVAAVAPDAGPTSLDNVASVGGPDTDPVPGNNTDDDLTTVVDSANITVAKTTKGPSPVDAGATTTFGIVVHNDGPSDADSVSVVDSLPAGMSLVSVSGPGWACNAASPIVCDRASVAAGADAPEITVVVRIGSGVPDGTTLTNGASTSTSTPGDDPADNADDATVDVSTSADLTVSKSHPAGPVAAGTQVTFTLAAANLGPSDALAPVTIVDRLPVGLTYVGSNGPWTCAAAAADASGQEVTCTLDGGGALIAGADAPVLEMTAQVAASVDDGTVTNTATVSSGTSDPDPDNNTDTDDVAVQTQADLSVVKSHTEAAHVGDALAFTLQVRNDGPSEARNVVVTDVLPDGLTFESAAGTDWTCTEADGTVTCELTGPLAPDTDAPTISVSAQVTPGAYPGVTNTADVTSSTADPDLTDNTSADPVEVPALVDLSVVKSHEGRLKVGEQATYRLVVRNDGPTADPGPVTVTDTLPRGLTFVSATGDGWSCTATGPTVTCQDADGLAADESSVILLVVAVEASAYPSVVNTAAVTSDAEDNDPVDNTATDPATVRPSIDLGIEKDLVRISRTEATWRITITNVGLNDTVADVVVVDDLPGELRYASVSGAGWTCNAVGRKVTCTHPGVIRVGGSTSFVITTTVVAGASGAVVNTATIQDDPGDSVDSADGELPAGSQPTDGLPDTGGPSAGWLVLGLLGVLLGLVAVLRGRRQPGHGRRTD